MRDRTLTVRAIALFGAASAAIHQLRYAIGYGDEAQHALAAHPHGYLSLLLPGVITATLIALAAALLRAARGGSAGARSRRLPLPALGVVCALALASIFAIQETLEGAGAVGHGGWIGLALAVPAGLFVALALRGADEAELRVVRPPVVIRMFVTACLVAPAGTHAARLLDLRLGARAPPRASVV